MGKDIRTKGICALLTAATTVSLLPANVQAAALPEGTAAERYETGEELPAPVAGNSSAESLPADGDSGYHALPGENEVAVVRFHADEDETDRFGASAEDASYIPEANMLPELRDQNPFSTCWAFSSTALAEIDLKKDAPEADAPDLSESHLSYFTYHSVTDPLGGTVGDSNAIASASGDRNWLTGGGSLQLTQNVYASWVGAAAEVTAPYSVQKDNGATPLDDGIAYSDAAHLVNYYRVNIKEDPTSAKQLILQHGALGVSYYSPSGVSADTGTSGVYNAEHKCFYDPVDHEGTNHAVVIVGWDDGFSKENFNAVTVGGVEKRPGGNGAWLIRNSWTDGGAYDDSHQGYAGYFWMSYETCSLAEAGVAFDFAPADNYDNNYQYDGAAANNFAYSRNEITAANVFTVPSSSVQGEMLRAVSFYTSSVNTGYQIEIYRGLTDAADPESGRKVYGATATGTTIYDGYYTVPLNQSVPLTAGEVFSVVITLSNPGKWVYLGAEASYSNDYYDISAYRNPQKSFLKGDDGWAEFVKEDCGNLRIKAFTNDIEETVPPTAISFTDPEQTAVTSVTIGRTGTFRAVAVVSPDGATDKEVTWSSGDGSIATVTADGLITGIALGTTTVTATAAGDNNITATLPVTVTNQAVSLSVSGDGEMSVRGSSSYPRNCTFSCVPLPEGAVFTGMTTWTSSDPTVLSIDESTGYATCLKGGTVTVTARNADATGSLTVQCYPLDPTVTVVVGVTGIVTLSWAAIDGVGSYVIRRGNPAMADVTIQAEAEETTCTWSDDSFVEEASAQNPTYTVYSSQGGWLYGRSWPVSIGARHDITYVLNGGTNAAENYASYREGKGFTLAAPTPPSSGVDFVGWYTDAACTAGNERTAVLTTDTTDLTLYAKYRINSYTVAFDGNGSTDGSMEDVTGLLPDASYTVPGCGFVRTGYNFTGWNTAADGSGASYAAGVATTDLTASDTGLTTLYAQWEVINYSVMLSAGAGTVAESGWVVDETDPTDRKYRKSYKVTDGTFSLPAAARTGWRFAGWLAEGAQEPVSSVSIATGSTGNLTYTACWRRSLDSDGITVTVPAQTWTGSVLTPAVTVQDGALTLTQGTDYTVTPDGERIHAGNYGVTVTAVAGEGTESYEGSASAVFTIERAEITELTPPTALTLSYTGEAQSLIAAGTVVGGTLQYSTDGIVWAAEIPTGTDAGSYTVYYRVAGDNDHEDYAAPAPVAVTISKADITPAVSIGSWVYGGTAATPVVTGNPGNGSVTFSYKEQSADDDDYSTEVPTAVGSYTVRAAIAESDHYAGGSATADFTIGKAANPAVILTSATMMRGTDLDLSGLVSGAEGMATYELTAGGDTGASLEEGILTAGDTTTACTITVHVAGNDSYEAKDATIAVTVVGKQVVSLAISQSGAAYGETLADPAVTGLPDELTPTIRYSGTLRKNGTDYSGTEKPAEAGSYTVTVEAEDTEHHYLGAASFVILPADISGAEITTTPSSLSYTGSAQTLTVTAVTLGETTLSAGDYLVTGDTATAAGDYELTVTAKDAGNYTGTATLAYSIERAAITPAVTISGWTYGGTAAVPSITGNPGSGAVTITYKVKGAAGEGTATVPEASGEYTLLLAVAETTNYQAGEASVDFVIAKAAAVTPENIMQTQDTAQTAVEISLAGAMPADAGTLTYTAGTVQTTGSVTADAFAVSEEGVVTATLSGAAPGDTVVFPVTVGSSNYADSTVCAVLKLYGVVAVTITEGTALTKTVGDAAVTLHAQAEGASDGAVYRWTSSKESVARITAEGQESTLTIVGQGTAVITVGYSEENLQGSATLTVTVKTKSSGGGSPSPGPSPTPTPGPSPDPGGEEDPVVPTPEDPADIAEAQVFVSGSYTYTGEPVIPPESAVTVVWRETTLVPGTDYTWTISSHTDAGDAIVTVTGKGSYTGRVIGSFTIGKAAHEDRETSASSRNGLSAAVPLRSFLEEGAAVGAIAVSDPEGILAGTPTVDSDGFLRYTLVNEPEKGGKSAVLTAPVTGAKNYLDYQITVTLTLEACKHHFSDWRILQEPTVFEEGKQTRRCDLCDAVETETIEKLPPDEAASELIDDAGEDTASVQTTTTRTMDDAGTVTESVSTVTVKDEEVSRTTIDYQTGEVKEETKIWIGGLSASYPYTGAAIRPAFHVYDGVKQLTEKTDYTVSYRNNKNAGPATLTVTFRGNYQGTPKESIEFTIAPADLKTMFTAADLAVTAKGTAGSEKKQQPKPSVLWRETGKALSAAWLSYDYTWKGPGYVDAAGGVSAPGLYALTVTPKNTNLTGSLTVSVQVIANTAQERGKDLAQGKAVLSAAGRKKVWTGSAVTLLPGELTVKDKAGNELTEGSDYALSYLNNTAPGTATVLIAAIAGNANGYVGSRKITFRITNGKMLSANAEEGFTISYPKEVPYAKAGAKPAVTVKDGETLLKQGTDYTVKYQANRKVTESASLVITGRGKYRGSVTLPFAVREASLSGLVVSVADKAESARGYRDPAVTITDADGKKLAKNKDYTIDTDYEGPDTDGTVSVTIHGIGCYEGIRRISYRYLPASVMLSKVRQYQKLPDQQYTGSAIRLTDADLTGVLYTGAKNNPDYLVPGTDFTVEGYSSNEKKGTARVTLRGTQRFGGTRVLTFKIVQKTGDYTGALVGGVWLHRTSP